MVRSFNITEPVQVLIIILAFLSYSSPWHLCAHKIGWFVTWQNTFWFLVSQSHQHRMPNVIHHEKLVLLDLIRYLSILSLNEPYNCTPWWSGIMRFQREEARLQVLSTWSKSFGALNHILQASPRAVSLNCYIIWMDRVAQI